MTTLRGIAQPFDRPLPHTLLAYWRSLLECVAKPSFQVVEAYERAAKMEERLVDVVPPLVAHRKPTVARKPRQRTLHHPPVPSELLARVDPPAGDAGGYAPLPERLPAAREVVCLVGVQLRGTLARPAGAPTRLADRRNGVHRLHQHLRVVDVGSAEDYRERDAPSVRNNVALRARFCLRGCADRRVANVSTGDEESI